MPLTSEEKMLCRIAARDYAAHGGQWTGTVETGYGPLGAVVVHRGGQFFPWARLAGRLGRTFYSGEPEPPPGTGKFVYADLSSAEQHQYATLQTLMHAVDADILAWSGYADQKALDVALLQHGAEAFPRE